MNIVWTTVFWIVGMFIFSFSTMQIILVASCTTRLDKVFTEIGVLNKSKPTNANIYPVIIHMLVTAGSILIVVAVTLPAMKFGFFIGYGMSFFLSIGKWGLDSNNISDYVKSNYKYFNTDKFNYLIENSNKLNLKTNNYDRLKVYQWMLNVRD